MDNMDNIYKYLNDIETDFSEYEEETLSPEEVSKIKSRVNKKLNTRKKNSNKSLTWIGRAAIITLCCLAVGGGVYAATTLRKNNADNLRIKSSQSETISDEGNKVTKKIFDEETGSELTYDVYFDGATATDAASIERVSKQDSVITVDVNLELDDISKFEPLRETFDHFVDQGITVSMNQETFDNFSLASRIDDTEMASWVNNYNITDNTLSIEIMIDTLTTKALNDGTDPNYPKYDIDPELGPDSLTKEQQKNVDDFFENYYASLPDPLNSTISIDLFLGDSIDETYTFETKLEGNYENGENARYDIDGGSATIEWYNQKESVSIDSYSIEANGLQLYGEHMKLFDWDTYYPEVEKNGLYSYEESLQIRAWDDLGNNYLLTILPSDFIIDPVTGEESIDTTYFTASLCSDGSSLEFYNNETGLNYCSEWADGISQITFAIEKFTCAEDGETREITSSVELISDPVTIDLK